MKNLWDELDSAICVKRCLKCDCYKATDTKADHDKIIKFLGGLNDSYAVIRSLIIIMKKNFVIWLKYMIFMIKKTIERNILPTHKCLNIFYNL